MSLLRNGVPVASVEYGCHNQPRDKHPTLEVPDGWWPDGRRRTLVIPSFAHGEPCRYDLRKEDVRCSGCREQ